MIGAAALVAGLVGRSRHLLPSALVLLGWGSGVLASEYVLPDGRQSSTYMLGIGIGALIARLVSRPGERSSWFSATAITAAVAGGTFSLAEQVTSLGGWKTWFATTLAWAVVEAVRPLPTADGGPCAA